MSSDDNHWRSLMTPTARYIRTCATSPPLLLILAFQLILFHTELFDCGVSNDLSKVTHLLVCIVLTPCFCFASSVCFDSFKNLILSSFNRHWCCFPSRRLPYTYICLSIFVFLRSMFAFVPLFVDFVRYLTFWHDMIQIQYIDAHAKSTLTISCVLFAAME